MKKTTMIIILTLNVIGTLIMLYVNYLSISLPLNNILPQEISQKYQTVITPPGITFSIWGIIYLSLISFLVYQIIKFYRNEPYVIEKTGLWYFTTTLLNSLWLFAWHYEKIILSTIIMVMLFINLIILYRKIGIGESSVEVYDKIFMFFPFSVYIGWISLATVLNISILLLYLNWNGFGITHDGWGFIIISLITCLGLTVILTKNDVFLGLTYIWALSGILSTKIKLPNLITQIKDPLTLSAVIAGIILISVSIVYKIIKKEVYS